MKLKNKNRISIMIKTRKPADKASILIISLWTICLLAIFAVYLGYNVRQKVFLIKRLEARANLRNIADAGVKKAIIQLLSEDPEKKYAALIDDWANNPYLFQDIDFGSGSYSVCYNYYSKGAQYSRFGLMDEERKININKADAKVLQRIFELVLNISEGEASGLAYSVIDWRDSDNQLSAPNGAESSYYQSLKHPYNARNAEFEVLDEILLVKGMNQDILNSVKDYVTIYGDGRVNINTASRQALLALGFSEKTADYIIEFRAGKDAIEGTADDNFFSQISDIVMRLQTRYNLSDIEKAEIESLASSYLSVDSSFFMIRSRAQLADKRNLLEATCVVNKLGKIFYWRES